MSHLDSHHAARIKERAQKVLGGSGQKEADQEKIYNEMREILKEQDRSVLDHVCPMFVAMERSHNQKLILALFSLFLPRCSMEIAGTVLRHYLARMTFLVETCRSDPSPGLSPDVLESSLIVQTMISFIRDLIPRQLYSDELMEKKPNKSKITWVFEPCYRGVVEGRKVLGKMLRAEGENKRSAMVYLRPTGVQIFKDLQSSRNLVEKLSDTDCDLRYGDHKTFSSVVNTLVQMMADQMPLDSFQRFLSVLPLFHSSSLSSPSSSFQPQGRFDQVKSPDGMGGSPLVSGSTPSPGSSIGFSPYQASTPPQHPLGINSSSSNPVGSSLGRTESGTTQRMMAMENGKSSMKGLPLLEACVKRTIHLIENSKVTDNQPLKELDWDTFMALSDSWLGNWLSFASMMYVFIEWHMLDLDQYLARLHQEMESLEGPNSRDNRVLWTILVCIPLKTPRESFSSDLNPDDLFLSSLLFSFVNERQAVTRNSVLFDVAVAALRMRISTMPECQSSPQVFQLLSPHQPYCDHFLNLLRVWYDKMRNQDLTNFHFIEHEMLCSLANCSSLPVSSEIIKSLSNSGKSKMYPIEFLSFLPHRVQRRITQRLSSSQRVAMPATTESLEYFVRALYLTDDMKIYFKFQTMACLPYVEILTFRLIRLLPYEPSSLINEMCSYPQAPNSQAPKGLGSQDQVRDRLADLLKTKLLLNMKEVSGVHNSKHVAGYRLHFRMVLLGLAKCLNVYGIVDYNQIKGLKKFIDRVKNVNYWHPKTIRFMPAMMRDRLVGHETRPSLVGSEVLANSNALAQQFQTSNVLEMCTKDPSLKHVLLSVLFFNSSHNNSPALADFLAQIPFLDLIENITVLVENVIRIAEAGDCEMTQIVEILNDLVWRHKVVPFHHLIFGLLERDDHPSCFEIINLLLFGTSVNGGTFSERFDAFIALNINPSFWKEDNFSEKSLKYFEQFPPRNSMEQSKKTAPKYEMDPLCFLTVLDVLVGRLIEFGNEALLNDVVIRFMPLYRYHDFPLTFIKNLLVYYDRSSSPDPFSSEPSFFLGIAVINSLFEFLEPQEFASIVEITQSPADQLSYLLWTRFIDRLANAIDSTKQHKSDVFQRFQEFPTKAKRELYLCVIGLLIIKNNLPHLDIASLILENLHGQLNVVLMPIHFCHLEAVGMIFAELPEPFHSSFLRYHSEIISKDPFLLDAVDHFNCEGAAAEYYYGMITGEYEEEVEGNRHQLYVNSVVMMHNFFTYSSLSVFESFFVDLILPYFDSPDKGPSIVYLFMLCKIVGPWVYRLGTKRRVIGKILEELFKYLQKVDEQRGWSGDSSALSVRLLDVVDDFFHHLKSIYNNKLSDTFNRLNDTAKKLSPALARRFAYVYSP